ncbi:MAG: ribonuclease D [Saprospiraceae bacterium]|jgi:ribonuclease D|tara:strand:+ start:611 stop:1771 length:1161 start_codon:yes stop_codon:yes gene_type:complete
MATLPNSNDANLPAPVFVSTSEQLRVCVSKAAEYSAIAIDTEFIRTDTFFPILGLVQIFNGDDCWLIDPLAISDLSPLTELLINVSVIKVFHSCSEDLEVLKHVLGCIPQPLFDTQSAAAFSGYGFSRGYASLVDSILGIHVEKGETRSDWLRRPLTDSQLRYAALDVIHLLPVYNKLCEILVQLGRKKWIDEEMSLLVKGASGEENLGLYFKKIKGASKLPPSDLSALQLICEWREIEARKRNRPRGRIVDDKSLLEIILKKPKTKNDLSDIKGMHPGLIRRYADDLLGLLRDGLARPESEHPEMLMEPLPRFAGATAKKLKGIVNAQAEVLDLAPEVLARKRDIEFLVWSIIKKEEINLPESIAHGWRYEAIGRMLLDACSKTT